MIKPATRAEATHLMVVSDGQTLLILLDEYVRSFVAIFVPQNACNLSSTVPTMRVASTHIRQRVTYHLLLLGHDPFMLLFNF